MTDFLVRRRLSRGTRVRIGYLVAGVSIGALWLAHAGESPWQHALRLLGLVAAVMTVATVVRRAAARRGRHLPHPPLGKFLLLKGALVALAVVAALVLEHWIADVDVWIGLGLVAVVAVLGPMVHPWLTAEQA